MQTVVVDDGSSFGLAPSSENPFGATIYQHEHALVDIDDDCQLLLGEQYSDDQEQADVGVAVADLQ